VVLYDKARYTDSLTTQASHESMMGTVAIEGSFSFAMTSVKKSAATGAVAPSLLLLSQG